MNWLYSVIPLPFKIFRTNKKKILFNSFPDFSDNAFALFEYLYNKNTKYKIVWLRDEKNKKLERRYKKVIFVRRKSIRGLYHLFTSKYVFDTHGIFSRVKRRRNQIVINLWHGMPLKKICLDDGKRKEDIAKFDYLISTSEYFQGVMTQAFGVSKNKVLISGQPRNDLLFKKENYQKIKKLLEVDNKKIVLWMPTYRKAIIGDKRQDGENIQALSKTNLKKIDHLLRKENYKLIIKLHPMDYLCQIYKSFPKFNNIKIITNDFFSQNNIQLYELVGLADKLITDFSSIFIDYLILDRPIGFYIEDLKEYEKTRGFYEENLLEKLPGPLIRTNEELIDFITKEIDTYNNNRAQLNKKYNQYRDTKSSERILKYFGIV